MTRSWKHEIGELFVPGLHRLTLVIDRDGLLSDERMVHDLQNKGFIVLEVVESIELRYEYELIRARWDFEDSKEELLLLCNPEHFEEREIPYDISSKAHRIEISLEMLFPLLYQPSIRHIEKQYYDQLREDVEDEGINAPLNERATNFILLRTLFDIEGNRVKSDKDVFLMLLKTHYHRRAIPSYLTRFLESFLKMKNRATGWQVCALLDSAELFWDYTQTIWESTLRGQIAYSNVGPSVLPFADREVSVYLDNVFREGFLQPVRVPEEKAIKDLPPSLVEVGTSVASEEELAHNRLVQLKKEIVEKLPAENALFSAWLDYQKLYAQLVRLSTLYPKDPEHGEAVLKVREKCNAAFFRWMDKHFDSLLFQKSRTPVLVSQIHSYLVNTVMHSPKVALVVIDGLSYDQWFTMKPILEEKLSYVVFEDDGCFAWVPSLTSVSRQAIFSGKPPRSFPKSIDKTSEEEKLWLAAWEREIPGLRKDEVQYIKNLGSQSVMEDLYSIRDSVKYLGLVVNSVDDIMHGMTLGNQGMHASIKTWMNGGYLEALLKGLLERKFEVLVVSDHGNIEAIGTGYIKEGSVVDSKGQRVRTYTARALRDEMIANHEDEAVRWDSSSLPEGYHAALSSTMGAFSTAGKKMVSHGGLSLEEVIVPFIRIVRKINE